MNASVAWAGLWRVWRGAWDRAVVYLPLILMGVLALGSYWLVHNTPIFAGAEAARAARHVPDYYLRQFSVRTFDADGGLKSEVVGAQARHFPDTDTLEIDQPRIRSFNDAGRLTTASANRALTNADGSEVQLFGNAVVVREPDASASNAADPRFEFRSEFLDAQMNDERLKTNRPVELLRGADRFTADAMSYDNLSQQMDLQGHVRGWLAPRAGR